MANKVALALLLICCFSYGTQAQGICDLVFGDSAFCPSSPCLIDASLLATVCRLIDGLDSILNITVPPSATINFGASLSNSISLGGIIINSNADVNAAVTINFEEVVDIANDLIVSGAAVINAARGTVVRVRRDLRIAAETTLNVAGTVTVAGATYINGKIHFVGDVVAGAAQTAWLIANSTTVTVDGGVSGTASISGNGGINASVVVTGKVTINAGNLVSDSIFFGGALTLSPTSIVKSVVVGATNFSRVVVQGAINRAGELLVELKENFVPVEGQVIIVATHASASGSFSVLRVTNSDGTERPSEEVQPSYAESSTGFYIGKNDGADTGSAGTTGDVDSSASVSSLSVAFVALAVLGLVL